MGGKQPGRGKQIYLCLALLIFLSPAGCALNQLMSTTMVDATGEEALARLDQGRRFLAREEYGDALKEYEKVLSLAGRGTPVDEALFYVGLINALPANPLKNQGRAVASFKQLMKEYPGSLLAEPAKAMAEMLQEQDNLNRRIGRLNNVIDELQKRVERLNNVIDGLQKVDVEIDQKRAEQAKPNSGALIKENERLNRTVERLNTIIDELKKVDIDVDQKKREQIK